MFLHLRLELGLFHFELVSDPVALRSVRDVHVLHTYVAAVGLLQALDQIPELPLRLLHKPLTTHSSVLRGCEARLYKTSALNLPP